ncbi:uncharacterized protein BJ171DRAFT_585964 [Polychytrium aggregatum]|uniref:uncharacterized protein n=1 Tax=Polychytrium aggregatum TaxID=110093 RepID=UPI0022FEBE8F|nr:uncharacterized protein BJ171DRAFT_585964 [Polychytrium aggregatum]KAI9197169.1 hypothetical protein BJ171DRAFT_585964 [Polychytrium aggregatum]
MDLRRAEPADAVAINEFIHNETKNAKGDTLEDILKKRYGTANAAWLIETGAFCGFMAINNGPTLAHDSDMAHVFQETKWDNWTGSVFEAKDIHIHNTKFLSFFVAEPECALEFLDMALISAFAWLPELKNISYLLPDFLILFPPLSLPRYTAPVLASDDPRLSTANSLAKGKKPFKKRRPGRRNRRDQGKYFLEVPLKPNADSKYCLYNCLRRDIVPLLKVRKAMVEDCDDLAPMFKKQNYIDLFKLLNGSHADYYLAELLESKTESTKTLVAEQDLTFASNPIDLGSITVLGPQPTIMGMQADGEIVGFLSATCDFDQQILTDVFQMDNFDQLWKEIQDTILPELPKGRSTATIDLNLTSRPSSGRVRADHDNHPGSPLPPTGESQATTGVGNIICINLFYIEPPFANQAIEFIKFAFSMFPERDYCVITIPTTAPELTLLKSFVFIPHRYGKIASRYGIGDPVSVRLPAQADVTHIYGLLEGLRNESEVIAAFAESLQSPEKSAEKGHAITRFKSLLIEKASQVVGILILEECLDPRGYTDQFDIEEYITLGHHSLKGSPVLLRHLVLNPLFDHTARFVLEEAMRILGLTCLLYPVDRRSKRDAATRQMAIREFWPVRRRREIIYPGNIRDGERMPAPIEHCIQLLSAPLLYESKTAINSRIVVIGGSDVGVAFLESLVYVSTFDNARRTSLLYQMTEYHPSRTKAFLRATDVTPGWSTFNSATLLYNSVVLEQIGLEHYVNIIQGSCYELDRVLKRITLRNGMTLAYDYLILTPGIQFQATQISEKFAMLHGVYEVTPQNLETITKEVEKRGEGTAVIVFGRNIQAFSTIEGKYKLCWIQAKMAARLCIFLVQSKMAELGIHIYRGWRPLKWESQQASLSSLTIASKDDKEVQTINNIAMFLYADEKLVDPDTFKSINDSSLVFDGRLVIDKYFRTQDPYIYAAGSITKYSSKYQTKWSHALYDSREVGFKLMETLLPLFDSSAPMQPIDDDLDILPFTVSKKVEARLPGDLYYLHCDKPRLQSHTLAFRSKQGDYGRDLVIDQPGSYFRIHVSPSGYIHSLTYLGVPGIASDNLLCLYGLHEKYLNRLVARFDEGVIKDFVSFLSEPWALPIYYDRFVNFSRATRRALLQDEHEQDEGARALVEKIRHFAARDDTPLPESQPILYKIFDHSSVRKKWDQESFEYLLSTGLFRSYP